uniref:Uncharacterized protein n=1 Tax=Anguilla anguilla TaxID=7936 RepID=A0A0E9WX97_ANGAN
MIRILFSKQQFVLGNYVHTASNWAGIVGSCRKPIMQHPFTPGLLYKAKQNTWETLVRDNKNHHFCSTKIVSYHIICTNDKI